MNCNDCIDRNRRESTCHYCEKMQAESRWIWELDNGCRRMRCPDCGGAMTLPAYAEKNPYRYCPYCGQQMIQGEQISIFDIVKEA